MVLVLELWQRTLALSVPVLAPGQQQLSPRQLRVALLLAVGEQDQVIARQLELSARTVEREVRAVLLTMSGRSASSRSRPSR